MSSGKRFGWEEVKKHTTDKDCWIVINGKVYDATSFLNSHPGGVRSILSNGGKDCTADFEAFHSDAARKQLQTLLIGDLDTSAATPSTAEVPKRPVPDGVALVDPQQPVIVTLKHKEVLSRDTRLFRFALPNPQHKLGLPLGGHVFLTATIEGAPCTRAYTPTSAADTVGHFDLVIKVPPRPPRGGPLRTSAGSGRLLGRRGAIWSPRRSSSRRARALTGASPADRSAPALAGVRAGRAPQVPGRRQDVAAPRLPAHRRHDTGAQTPRPIHCALQHSPAQPGSPKSRPRSHCHPPRREGAASEHPQTPGL